MESSSQVQVANKQWLYLGCEYDRWQTLKMKCGVSTDVELLTMLLDCYIQLHMKGFEVLPVATDLFGPLEDCHENETGPDKVIKTGQVTNTSTTKVKSLENSRDISIQIKVDQETITTDNEPIESSIGDSFTSSVDNETRKLVAGSVANETNSKITGCEDIIIKQEPLSPSSSQDTEHCEDSFTEEGSIKQQQDSNNRRNEVMNNADISGQTRRKGIKSEKCGSRKLYYCDLCDHTSFSRGNLYRHRKAIHYKTKISCPECGKLFTQNYYLAQHRRSIHENNKLKCNWCPETFNATSTLRRHRMLKHSTEGRYTCELCDAKFYDKNMYEGHCNTHTNAKPYTCRLCMKTFKYKSSLYRHEITCHNPDSARFECDQCDKTMKTKGGLTAHKRIVHGDKDQICICEKSFTTITALKRHQRACSEANFGIIRKGDGDTISIFL